MITKLKNIMKKLWEFIKSIVPRILEGLFDFAKKHAELAVKVTNALKEAVEHPAADFLVNLTKTDLDNKALAILRKVLTVVVKKVAVVHGVVSGSEDENEAIRKLVEHIRSLPKDERPSYYVQFAAEVLLAYTNGRISVAQAYYLPQLVYDGVFSKK